MKIGSSVRNQIHQRKLHVSVDDDGFIVAAKLTKSSDDDPLSSAKKKGTLRTDKIPSESEGVDESGHNI